MDCGSFGILARLLVSWEHGSLSVVLSLFSLVVGGGLAVKTQDFRFVGFSIGMALILFFFPQEVEAITGVNVDACTLAWSTSEELAQDLRACSEALPSYSGPGRSCLCAAMSATPACSQAGHNPVIPSLGPGSTGAPIQYANGQFSGGPESISYTSGGQVVTYTLQAEGQCVIETENGAMIGEDCE